MKNRLQNTVISSLVLIVITFGCGTLSSTTSPDPETDGAALATPTTQSSDLGELSYIFEIPADPVDVAVTLDTEGTVEALIPVEGGSISATGADGTVYTLEIPSDALLEETMISLTPVTSISGMPFGGEQTYAVQLSPEGLFLQNFAILTITPAVEIPIAAQLVFGYLGKGKDVILAATVVDSNEIKINVLHFSGNGVTNGLMEFANSVREFFGGNVERRLENALNEELIRIRQQGGDSREVVAAYEEALRQYEDQVVRPRVADAGESCAAGTLAIQTVYRLGRQRQLLGLDSEGGDPLERYPGLRDTVTQVCMEEEYKLCAEEHVIWRILPAWRSFERQYILTGNGGTADNAVLQKARELTIKCMTFRLEFESTAKWVGEGTGWESSVFSELILRYDPEKEMIIGAVAELVNTHFKFWFNCPVTSIPGDGIFTVIGMSYELDGGEPDEDGGYPDVHVTNIKIVYMPGQTSESIITQACKLFGGTSEALMAWTTSFVVVHGAEMDAEPGGFVARDWEIFEDHLFAKKEWNPPEIAETTEEGSFKLYHEPGR